MSPISSIDKFVLVLFCGLLIVIGVFPAVIAPIVEAGVRPVVVRVAEAQQVYTVMSDVQSFFQMVVSTMFGGA